MHVPSSQVDEPSNAESKSGKQARIGRLFGSSYRVEHLVLVDVAGVHVVVAVTELPLVVGDHEEGVRDGADDVVEQREDGEGAVTAVVADYEQREEERALSCPVRQHGRHSHDTATRPRLHQPQCRSCQHDLYRVNQHTTNQQFGNYLLYQVIG